MTLLTYNFDRMFVCADLLCSNRKQNKDKQPKNGRNKTKTNDTTKIKNNKTKQANNETKIKYLFNIGCNFSP